MIRTSSSILEITDILFPCFLGSLTFLSFYFLWMEKLFKIVVLLKIEKVTVISQTKLH